MKVEHPNTHAVLVMNDQCQYIGEIERYFDDGELDYQSVQVGVIGYNNSLLIMKEDWEGFKALVAEIDREWS
jgi:hypothetical protein